MQTQNLKSEQLDKLIDKFLSADAPVPSSDFVERTMSKESFVRKAELEHDSFIDTHLAKFCDFPNITESVIVSIKREERSFRDIAMSIVTVMLATTACLLVVATSLVSLETPQKWTITENDFAQMADIDDKINEISLLVMQEEMLDILR